MTFSLIRDKAATVVLLDGRHRLKALRDLHKAAYVACVDATLLVRCFTRHDGRPIAEAEALKLSSFANKVTSVVRCDFSFVAVVKTVINFSAAFEKGHSMLFLAASMVNSDEDMVSSDFLSRNCSHIFQHYPGWQSLSFNPHIFSI